MFYFCLLVLHISTWFIVLFKSSISLLARCFAPYRQWWCTEVSIIIIELFLSSILSMIVSYILGLSVLWSYNSYVFCMIWHFYQYIMSFLLFVTVFDWNCILSDSIVIPALFWLPYAKNCFPFSHFLDLVSILQMVYS